MFCVNFHSVAVYNSAVMEFWPLSLEQRIKLFSEGAWSYLECVHSIVIELRHRTEWNRKDFCDVTLPGLTLAFDFRQS